MGIYTQQLPEIQLSVVGVTHTDSRKHFLEMTMIRGCVIPDANFVSWI